MVRGTCQGRGACSHMSTVGAVGAAAATNAGEGRWWCGKAGWNVAMAVGRGGRAGAAVRRARERAPVGHNSSSSWPCVAVAVRAV